MTAALFWVRSVLWLVRKDLLREVRARSTWIATLALGVLFVITLSIHLDIPEAARYRVAGGLFWMAMLFGGACLVERLYALEREQGCWQALASYPLSPSAIFLAKWAVLMLAMAGLEGLLLPLFAVMAQVPLLERPAPLLVVVVLANAGFAALGVLLGAVTCALRERGFVLVLLLLPLTLPLTLSCAEATRLLLAGEFAGPWYRWLQMLGVFATLYTVSGTLLFEFVTEDAT